MERSSAVRAVAVLGGRELQLLRRSTRALVMTLAMPVCVYLVLVAGFSKIAVVPAQFGSFEEYALPMPIVFGVVLGAVSTAALTAQDRNAGLMARLQTLAIPSYGVAVARVFVDALRATGIAAAVILVGLVLGVTPDWSTVAWVVACAVLLALPVSAIGVAVGMRAVSAESAQATLLPAAIAVTFVSVVLVPVGQFPGWIQPIVSGNPISLVATQVRYGIGTGGPADLAALLAWVASLFALGIALIVRWGRER